MSSLQSGAMRHHGTRITRGVPLPVYMNLDLYSAVFGVLLVVLCFNIMYLLSQTRSFGRCF